MLGSLFAGDKPRRRAASAAETALAQAAGRLEGSRAGLDNVAALYNESLRRGRTAERADALGTMSADVAHAFSVPTTGTNQALNNLITRGKGLQRVVSATANQFDSQLMRDRIAAVAGGRARQGRGIQALGGVASIQDNIANAAQRRRDVSRAARQNTLGAVAGLGLGVFANRGEFFPSRNLPEPVGSSTTGTLPQYGMMVS